jgi:crotonobetaine/carnitine-CoA ligase
MTNGWKSGHQTTVEQMLTRRLESDPDDDYLDVCGTELSAAEVASISARLANAVRQMGVEPGDRIATLIENSAEATLAGWGAVRSGAIVVPINNACRGEYLRHQLADSDARVLVAAALIDRTADDVGWTPLPMNRVGATVTSTLGTMA